MRCTETELTRDKHLASDFLKTPRVLSAIYRVKEVGPQPCRYCLTIGVFCPVGSKRIEIVATEVNHRIELVHKSETKP